MIYTAKELHKLLTERELAGSIAGELLWDSTLEDWYRNRSTKDTIVNDWPDQQDMI